MNTATDTNWVEVLKAKCGESPKFESVGFTTVNGTIYAVETDGHQFVMVEGDYGLEAHPIQSFNTFLSNPAQRTYQSNTTEILKLTHTTEVPAPKMRDCYQCTGGLETCECPCGEAHHEIECKTCDGTGKRPEEDGLEQVLGRWVRFDGPEFPHHDLYGSARRHAPVRFFGLVANGRLVWKVIDGLPAGDVTVETLGPKDVIRIRGTNWIAGVMPLQEN